MTPKCGASERGWRRPTSRSRPSARPSARSRSTTPSRRTWTAFRRALHVAEYLASPYIRIFSFFVPEGRGGRAPRRGDAAAGARCWTPPPGHPVTLLHENERHIYGDIPRRCHDLMSTLASPQLRFTFDPANFVHVRRAGPSPRATSCSRTIRIYLHIKDGLMAEHKVVPAGAGRRPSAPNCISALLARGYEGFASLEPHLSHGRRLFAAFRARSCSSVAAEAFRTRAGARLGAQEG